MLWKNKLFILNFILCLLFMMMALTGCTNDISASFEKRLIALEPYTPPEIEAPERYYDEIITEFIPSEDYGRVYPYIGQVQTARPNREGYWFPYSCLYGFADEDGRIICDPVYSKATLLTFGDKSAYVLKKAFFPNGAMTTYQVNSTGTIVNLEEWLDQEREEAYYAVVSLDGSFFAIYDEVFYGEYDDGIKDYEYIAVKKDNLWGVIDYDGTEILPCRYDNAPLFSEGLAAVYESDDSREYYYIDQTGKRILGPLGLKFPSYQLQYMTFSHGRAINSDGDFYGFIDTSGKLVVPRIYAHYFSGLKGYDENGLAFVVIMDYEKHSSDFNLATARYGIIDINGEYIMPLRKTIFHNYSNFYGDHFQEGDYYFNSKDRRSWQGVSPINEKAFNDAFNNKNCEIFNYKDGEIKIKESINYKKCLGSDIFTIAPERRYDEVKGEWICLSDPGVVNIRTGEVYYSGDTPYVFRDGFFSLGLGSSWWGSPYGGSDVIQLEGRSCVIGYLDRNQDYWYEYEQQMSPKFGVLDKNGPVLEFEYDYLQWVDGYFCVVQGDYGGLLRPDGTWFVKVLLESFAD